MRKFIKVMLVGTMLLALMTGCSNEKESDASIIKLGGSGPLTGGAAIYGLAVKNAAELAVEEVNAKGGDIKFELNIQDDVHDPEKAVTCYNVLTSWGMQISLGCVTSAPGAAVSQNYADDKTFALTPSGSSPTVTLSNENDPNSYYGNVFQMCFTDPAQGTLSAQYIKENNIGTKVAVIYKNDDNYSTGVFNRFKVEAERIGLDFEVAGAFDDATANDFSSQLIKAQSMGADVVFLPIYYTPASLIFTQANSMGYSPIFFGIDGMDGILAMENFDTKLAEGVYLLTPFSASAQDELTVNFVKNYKEKYGEVPNQFAADAYDCVYAIYQACLAGKVNGSMSNEEICDILVKQFTSMTFEGLTGSNTWSVNGEVAKSPKAVIIKDGEYVSAE